MQFLVNETTESKKIDSPNILVYKRFGDNEIMSKSCRNYMVYIGAIMKKYSSALNFGNGVSRPRLGQSRN